jgi:hypothetical protein
MDAIWTRHNGTDLRQGDILEQCVVASISDTFEPDDTEDVVNVETARLIVVTQSCDLENGKAPHVALCPIYTLEEFEISDERFKSKGRWEEVRKGKVEGLYLLPGVDQPQNNRDALVVDFRLIVSLPIGYVQRCSESLEGRPRLLSPYVEHFSQSFARFFMRVGLPSQIPAYK